MVTGEIVTGQGSVEATGGANLVEGNPLVGGVRDAAVARSAPCWASAGYTTAR